MKVLSRDAPGLETTCARSRPSAASASGACSSSASTRASPKPPERRPLPAGSRREPARRRLRPLGHDRLLAGRPLRRAPAGLGARSSGRRWSASTSSGIGDPDSYRLRETSPLSVALEALRDSVGARRRGRRARRCEDRLARRVLDPAPEVLDTMRRAARARASRVGLVSNCTEDVAIVWADTPFAPLFDYAVFSATAGCAKPRARDLPRSSADGLGVDAVGVPLRRRRRERRAAGAARRRG